MKEQPKDEPGPAKSPPDAEEPLPPVRKLINALSKYWPTNTSDASDDLQFDRVKATVALYESPLVLELLEQKHCFRRIAWREFEDTLEPYKREGAITRRRAATLLICQLFPVAVRMRATALWDDTDRNVIKEEIMVEFLRAVQEELLAPGKPMEIDAVRMLTVVFSSVEVDLPRECSKPYVGCGLWRALPTAARNALIAQDEFYASAWADVEGRERASPDPSELIAGIVARLMDLSLRATVADDVDFDMLSAILELMIVLLGQLATRRFVEPLVAASGTGAAVAALAQRLSPAQQKVKQQVAKFLAELRAPVDGVTGQEMEFDERQRRHAADVVRLQQECLKLAAPSLETIAHATVDQIGAPDTFAAMIEGVAQAGELPLLLKATGLDMLVACAAENDRQVSLPWPLILAAHYKAPELPALRGPLPDADALFSAPPVLPWARKRFLTFEDLARHCSTFAELETADELVRQLAEALLRLDVRADGASGGWARDAVLLTDNLVPVARLDAGGLQADVTIDLTPFPEPVRAEWRAVKSQDQFCVITLAGRDSEAANVGQPPAMPTFDAAVETPSVLRNAYGIRTVHPTQLVAVANEDGNVGGAAQILKLQLSMSGAVPENPLHAVLLRLRPAVTEAVARTAACQMLLDPAHRGRFQLPQWCHATMLGHGGHSGASMHAVGPQTAYLGDMFYDSARSDVVGSNVRRAIDTGSGLCVVDVGDDKAKYDEKTVYRELKKSELGDGAVPPHCDNSLRFERVQLDAIVAGCARGLSVFRCGNASGKTVAAAQIVATLYHAPGDFAPSGPTALITSTEAYLERVLAILFIKGVRPWHVARPGTDMQLEAATVERRRLLGLTAQIAAHLGVPETFAESATAACEFFRSTVQPRWASFRRAVARVATVQAVWRAYPFPKLQEADAELGIFEQGDCAAHARELATRCYRWIAAVFSDLEVLKILEELLDPQDQAKALLQRAAKIVVGRSAAEILAGGGARPFSSIIVLGAAQLRMADVLPAIASASVERICLMGTHHMPAPAVSSGKLCRLGARGTLFEHLLRPKVNVMGYWGNRRCETGPFWIVSMTAAKLVTDSVNPTAFNEKLVPAANAGFACVAQTVQVPGLGETHVSPGRIVREVEADYVVSVFQYMRLIGYEADRVAIVCMTDAQADLVRDMIAARCGSDPQYGWPAAIVTPYQAGGVECEIVLVSLVYTLSVPEALTDPRAMAAVLSRASNGVYFFGELGRFSEGLIACLDRISPMDALYLRGRELADGSVRRHPRNIGMDQLENGDWEIDEEPLPPVYRIESADHMAAHVAWVAAERDTERGV